MGLDVRLEPRGRIPEAVLCLGPQGDIKLSFGNMNTNKSCSADITTPHRPDLA